MYFPIIAKHLEAMSVSFLEKIQTSFRGTEETKPNEKSNQEPRGRNIFPPSKMYSVKLEPP